MDNIRYVIKDIKNNKIIMVIFCVLNIIMLCLVGLLSDVINDTRQSMRAVEDFENRFSEAYIAVDTTSEEKFSEIISDTDKAAKEYNDLFTALSDNNISFYTTFGYDMYVTEEGNTVREQVITDKFFDVFNLSVLEGRKFEKEDFTSNADTIPVMVGYQLRNEYKVGKTYEFTNGGTGEIFKGNIVGVLDKNSEYNELNNYNVSLSLDYSYIIPQDINNMGNLSFSDLDMAETRMVVFGEKNEIQKVFSTKSPIDITLVNVNDKVDYIIETQMHSLIIIGGIAVAFLSFSLVIIYIGFSRLFKKQMKEYKIHLFCGAKKSDIVLRFLSLSYLMLIIGLIVASIIYQNADYAIKMIVFAAIFGVLTGIYPYIVLRREMR